MSHDSFRALLSALQSSNLLRTVSSSVNPKHELVSVMRRVQKAGNEPLLFKDVNGFRVATNVFGRRETMARALDFAPEAVARDLCAAGHDGPAPVEVSRAPVQEVDCAPVDIIRQIPQVVHSELDAGAYISAGVCIAAHPKTGVYNASWNRIQLVQADHARIRMMAPQQLGQYHAVAEQSESALPVAIAIGAPPALMLSAASKIPIEADEYRAAGRWQGAPLRVVRARTIPLMVPADAEYIIEGEVLPNVMEEEGPFGEFTDAYADKAPNNVLRVKAITHRADPVYHVILAGGSEDGVLLGLPLQAVVYEKVSRVADVVDVATPGHIFGCVISIRKHSDDQAQRVVREALGAHAWMKIVVVVDDDVNPHDATEVLWAIHTRHRPDTGICHLQSVGSFQRADVREIHQGKLGIDATVPVAMRRVFRRRHFPGMEHIDLGSYLDPLP